MASDGIFTEAVIQAGLVAAADEMFAVLKKTAMSPIIYEVLDVGTGITDAEGNLVSSGAGIPTFVGVLDKAVRRILELHPADGISDGDIFITNDPYYGGVTHLNDIIVAMPVFADGRIIAWTANIAHNSDVGGMAPGSLSGEATEIFQEGLRLPAIKIISKGQPIGPVMDIIKANSRMPDVLEGDVWAAIASVRVGDRRLKELAGKYGVTTFENAMDSFMDYGEKTSVKALQDLPHGTFELSEEQDDGRIFNVKITISDAEFTVDLRDNPDQSTNPVNTSRDGVMVAAQMIFKSLSDPYSPANGGSFRPINLLTRGGSVFHAKEPAPIGFYYEIELRVYDLMWRCLAPHMPTLLPAGHFSTIAGTFIGGIVAQCTDNGVGAAGLAHGARGAGAAPRARGAASPGDDPRGDRGPHRGPAGGVRGRQRRQPRGGLMPAAGQPAGSGCASQPAQWSMQARSLGRRWRSRSMTA